MNDVSRKSFDELTETLFDFLNDGILSVRGMLEQLTELRAAVIRRDEKTLAQMSEKMSELAAQRTEMQRCQRQLCEAFARLLNCRAEDVNVSYLTGFLEADRKKELKNRQQTLRQLTARLSSEHRATEQLLRECERLNRMMLEGIVGVTNHTLTYGQGGQVRRELHCAVMSTRM
jgi:predicted RNase H-like nuclease (RuvC/YqgF family)